MLTSNSLSATEELRGRIETVKRNIWNAKERLDGARGEVRQIELEIEGRKRLLREYEEILALIQGPNMSAPSK